MLFPVGTDLPCVARLNSGIPSLKCATCQIFILSLYSMTISEFYTKCSDLSEGREEAIKRCFKLKYNVLRRNAPKFPVFLGKPF